MNELDQLDIALVKAGWEKKEHSYNPDKIVWTKTHTETMAASLFIEYRCSTKTVTLKLHGASVYNTWHTSTILCVTVNDFLKQHERLTAKLIKSWLLFNTKPWYADNENLT